MVKIVLPKEIIVKHQSEKKGAPRRFAVLVKS